MLSDFALKVVFSRLKANASYYRLRLIIGKNAFDFHLFNNLVKKKFEMTKMLINFQRFYSCFHGWQRSSFFCILCMKR